MDITSCRICMAGPFVIIPARPDPSVCLDCDGREVAAAIEAHAEGLGLVVDVARSTTGVDPLPHHAALGWTHLVTCHRPRSRRLVSLAMQVADDGTVVRATTPA